MCTRRYFRGENDSENDLVPYSLPLLLLLLYLFPLIGKRRSDGRERERGGWIGLFFVFGSPNIIFFQLWPRFSLSLSLRC